MATAGAIIPLIILFVVVGGGGYIGYQIYLWSNEMTDRGKKHMEKKHMTFTKDGGLKVGVKELKGEAYEDKTQNVLVNVWQNAQPGDKKKPGSGASTPRPSTSRTNSSQKPPTSRTTSSSANASNLSPPASRSGRPASPVPGGWS